MMPFESISHAPHHPSLHYYNESIHGPNRALSTFETPFKRLCALPETQMAKYFHLSLRDAARVFSVGTITLKRICKRRGIQWPTDSSAANEMRSRL